VPQPHLKFQTTKEENVMFCTKCGANVVDSADFCPNCGARLDKTPQQPEAQNTGSTNQSQGTVPNSPEIPNKPIKEKSKKLWIVLGVLALLVVIIIAAFSGEEKTDYVATVKAYEPFASSQNLPYTCGEVFSKYIDDLSWSVINENKETDTAEVVAKGTIKGTDYPFSLVIKISPSDIPDIVNFDFTSLKIVGDSKVENDIVEFMYFMFKAYDDGYDDLSELVPDELNDLGRHDDSEAPSASTSPKKQQVSSLAAEDAEQLIIDWINEKAAEGYMDCFNFFPEYVGESIINGNDEAYQFNLYINENDYVNKSGSALCYVLKRDGTVLIDNMEAGMTDIDQWFTEMGFPMEEGSPDFGTYGSYDMDAQYISPSYAELMRYYENYTGEKVAYWNYEVVQIISEDLISIRPEDFTSNEIFIIDVGYISPRVLEGDLITVYGTFVGLENMESAFGDLAWDCPFIIAEYLCVDVPVV